MRRPEGLSGSGLDLVERIGHLIEYAVGKALAAFQVGVAGLGRNREPGRHRHADLCHVPEVGRSVRADLRCRMGPLA